MSDHKPEDEPSTSQMKRRRIDDDKEEEKEEKNVMDEEAPNQLAIAAASNEGNEGNRPQIFKLDVDCVQEMFDYLSIKDINSVAQTCTRMHRIAGDYFETNLAALEIRYEYGQFEIEGDSETIGNELMKFVQKLIINPSYGASDKVFHFIGQHFKSLKQITFENSRLNADKIEHIKPILSEIETVKFHNVSFDGEFYENFLQFCPKLKYLSIEQYTIGTNDEWFLRSYPTLEHLEYSNFPSQVSTFVKFFERNPNVQKSMSTNSLNLKILERNFLEMPYFNIKLQVLTIGFKFKEIEDPFVHLLKRLYDKGIYQRLHLRIYELNQQAIQRISALNGLHSLCVYGLPKERVILNSLINLKELRLGYLISHSIDLESTARALVNLERLHLEFTDPVQIEPFIEFSAKLKVIRTSYSSFYQGNIHNILSSWNKKREKLVGARKVTIYLKDRSFVEFNWKNATVDFNLIQMKRAESYNEKKAFPFIVL